MSVVETLHKQPARSNQEGRMEVMKVNIARHFLGDVLSGELARVHRHAQEQGVKTPLWRVSATGHCQLCEARGLLAETREAHWEWRSLGVGDKTQPKESDQRVRVLGGASPYMQDPALPSNPPSQLLAGRQLHSVLFASS